MGSLHAGTCSAQPAVNLQGQHARPCQHALIFRKPSYVRQNLCSGAARCPQPPSRRSGIIMHAAAASAGSEDPYKVLGLSRGADSNAVNRAYKRLVFENRQNDAEKARIESAHSSIMMSQLSARMKGGVEVAKDIKYADKAVYFPWRPRRHHADKQINPAVADAVMAV